MINTVQIFKTMVGREVVRIIEQIERYRGRKIAIFTAGPYARRFFRKLLEDHGIEASMFIDNDESKCGGTIAGKPVLLRPWEDTPSFVDDYFVLIATCDTYCREIASQLDEQSIPHLTSDAYQAAHLWERCQRVVDSLDDDFSKSSYLALVWYWLTRDNSFIQTVNDQYFGHPKFVSSIGETVVDVGAFVGDTTEEYVRRGGVLKLKIHAFEPDASLRAVMEKRVKRLTSEWALPDDAIEIVAACVGAETGEVYFAENGCSGAIVCEALAEETLAKALKERTTIENRNSANKVKMYSLDDYFKDKTPPTIIKADIEGAELDMLKGARAIIENDNPKLAICIYHFLEDMVEIYEYICSPRGGGYAYSVRNHSADFRETVLYAWR